MTSQFDYLAEQYDELRASEQSAFYQFELSVVDFHVVSILRGLARPTRILDIGIGTGVWTLRLLQLAKWFGLSAETVGIDTSPEMLGHAETRLSQYAVRLKQVECRVIPTCNAERHFDLILSSLSVDYIGAEVFASAVSRTLAQQGRVLLWLYDHSRYPGKGAIIRKTWRVGERLVQVSSNRTELDDVLAAFPTDRWRVGVWHYAVPTTPDQLRRALFVFEITRRQQGT